MTALLMGIVGFGLGLFFGWMLHRERMGGADTRQAPSDRVTSTLADTSVRLEEADQDVVELRTQLTDAQHMLDESAATIAELEFQLAECRGDAVDETMAIGTDELAAEDAAAPAAFTEADIDEVDVTEEVAVAEPVDEDEEIAEAERTQEDLSAINDETEVIAVGDGARPDAAVDETQTIEVDETEVIDVPADDTEVIERAAAADTIAEPEPDAAGDVVAEEPEVVAEPVAPAVDEPAGDEAAVAEPVEEPAGDEATFVPPPDAGPDDLKRIRGVGPAMARLLNEQGITTFRQLAVLDDAGIDELESRLPGFSGRVRRDRWVDQARDLHIEVHGDQP